MDDERKDDLDEWIDGLGAAPGGKFMEFTGDGEGPQRGGRRSVRDEERLIQGVGAVFSVRRAAELLPGRDDNNRRWLRAQKGLIRKAANGADVVVWGEVLDRLPKRDGDEGRRSATSVPAAGGPRSRLRRVDLGSLR